MIISRAMSVPDFRRFALNFPDVKVTLPQKSRFISEVSNFTFKYSDDQPRDESGRWTDAGGGGSTGGGSDASSAAQDVYTVATGSEGGITQHIKDAVTNNGGEMRGLEFRIKAADSLARKIESDAKVKGISAKDAAAQINDSLRYRSLQFG